DDLEREARSLDARHRPDLDGDATAIRELHCIAHEIDEHLAQTQTVREHHRVHCMGNVTDQIEPFALCTLGEDFESVLHHFPHSEALLLEFQLAGLDLGEIEYVVDQLQERLS